MAFTILKIYHRTKKFQLFFGICLVVNVEMSLGSVSLSDFVPYSESDGNSRFHFGDDNSIHVSFTNSPFALFNQTYWSTYISGNGLISFEQEHSNSVPDCNQATELKLIVPFWADANEGVDPGNSRLTFMESTNSAYLTNIARDIRRGFFQHRRITLSWMFVVTWKSIPPHDSNYRSKRNTFQLILASNGISSFVLFYYNRIEWINGAAAGFDLGSRRRYKLPGSCSNSIDSIATGSNINVPGKWVFQVDKDVTVPSLSSFQSESCDTVITPIQIDPPVVPIIGNIPLLIHGLCLEENATVTCKYVDKGQLRPSETKAVLLPDFVVCPLPFLYSLGALTVNILVSYPNQNPTIHTKTIFVVKEHEYNDLPSIYVNKTENSLFLSAHWDPSLLAMTAIRRADQSNESNPDVQVDPKHCQILSETVRIVVLEYDGKKWKNQGPITPPILNNGVHMSPLNMSRIKTLLQRPGRILLKSLAIESTYKLQRGQSVRKLISANSLISTETLIDLIIGLSINSSEKTHVFNKLCENWYNNEPVLNVDTLPCPNIVDQARLDWRFKLETAPQKRLLNNETCTMYIQRVASPSGAATKCVYDNEGRLLVWPRNGGSVLRRSPDSITGYWRHYQDDLLPYMYCCKWGGLDKCPRYFSKRPVDFGLGYAAPRPMRAVGDPHLTTFDGLAYTFNGAGEYWMIKYNDEDNHKIRDFKMQIRMDPFLSLDETSSNASVITAAVMEEITSEYDVKVQVVLNSAGEGLSVFVDDEPLNVFEKRLDSQDTNNEHDVYPKNDAPWNFQNEFTFYHFGVMVVLKETKEADITFSSGLSLNFKAVHGESEDEAALNIVGSAGADLKNKIVGLFGNYDELKNNDFQLPNGTCLETNATMEDIHKNFGSYWLVTEKESIFFHSPGKSYTNRQEPAFTPWLLSEDEISELAAPDEDFCDDFKDCVFDYLATGSRAIGIGTKASSALFQEIEKVSGESVGQCNFPTSPVNGYVNGTSVVIGSTIELWCNFTDSLSLTGTFICTQRNQNGESPAVWLDSKGVVYHSSACELLEKTGSEISVEGVKPEKISTSSEGSNHSGESWIIFIGMLIFIVTIVVVIAEYPPCKPVKNIFTDKYRYYRYRISSSHDDNINLS